MPELEINPIISLPPDARCIGNHKNPEKNSRGGFIGSLRLYSFKNTKKELGCLTELRIPHTGRASADVW